MSTDSFETQNPKKQGLSKAEQTARARSSLLHAALDIIAERGYQRASLAAIGERAGYSRGVVNFHFGSKAVLLATLVESMFDHWRRTTLGPIPESLGAADALCAGLASVRDLALDSPSMVRAFYVLLFEALGPLPELRPRFASLHELLRADVAERIRAGINAGDVRSDIDPEAQAALLVGSIRGVMYQWLLDPGLLDLTRVFDELQQNVRSNLRSV